MAARLQTRVQFAAEFRLDLHERSARRSQRAQALSWFAGPAVTQSTLDRDSAALGLRAAVVLDAHGHVIRASTSAPGTSRRHARGQVRETSRGTFARPDASGVALTDVDGTPMLTFAVAYQTSSGRRVFTGAYAMSDVGTARPFSGASSRTAVGRRISSIPHGGLLTAIASGGPQASTLAQADPRLWAAEPPRAGRLLRQPAGQAVLRHRAGRGNLVADRAAATPRRSCSRSSTAPAGGSRGSRSPGWRLRGSRSSS